MQKKKVYILIGGLSFLFGILLGAFALYLVLGKNSPQDFPIRQGGYTFINPLLACDISENKQFSEYKPTKDKLTEYIDQSITQGNAQKVSVYFRGLNDGRWAGVNENEKYSPASLLKVLTMIAYLKRAETEPGILDQKVTYDHQANENGPESIKPQRSIENGGVYTIADLLNYMIAYSDNNATFYLQNNIDQNSFKEVYSDLGVPLPSAPADDIVTAKEYAYVFRLLYNATYLSKPMSQYALKLLSTADFTEGIKAGIPDDVVSSQKFGERSILYKDPATGDTHPIYRELHDCGIVYYPHDPYLLCVMTKGQDLTKLKGVISSISRLIYQDASSGAFNISS